MRGEPGEEPSKATPEKISRTEPLARLIADAAHLGRAAGRPFQADEGEAAQDEQEGERDDEGGQPRADHDLSVQAAQQAATTKVSRDGDEQRPAAQRR